MKAVRKSELDTVFLLIAKGLLDNAQENAAKGVKEILNISSKFLSRPASESLAQFRDLYFKKSDELQSRKDAANDSVDELIEKMKSGAELTDEGGASRVGLAAFQKRLEGVISLETGLKKKLAPVLCSLQFEDAMSQRLGHVYSGIQRICENLLLDVEHRTSAEVISKDLASTLSSDAEREIYYRIVLKEPAPAGLGETSVWLDFAS